jgi:hypothetical protein
MVADLDASGDVVFAVGGFVGCDELSVRFIQPACVERHTSGRDGFEFPPALRT